MIHPEFPFVAFLSAALVLVPLPWHWRAGNVATLSIIAWLFVVNVIYGVDAVIWGDTLVPTLAIWCDITTKIIIGANIALPAACMCVCIHLEQVASVRNVRTSREDKARRQIREAILCFLVPMIWMGLHYIVQGHRFDIIEGFGCRPSTYVSLPAIFLIWFPPLLMSLITAIFALLTINHFIRRRITFARHLESSGLNMSRYLRLIMMAISELVVVIASTTASLVFSVKVNYRPWTNWNDVHWNFSRIDRFPAAFLPPSARQFYTGLWWIIPASSILFFLFFGFGQEAVKEYSACFAWIRTHVLRFKPTRKANTSMASRGIGRFVTLPQNSSSFASSATVGTSPSRKSTTTSISEPLSPTSPVIDIKKAEAAFDDNLEDPFSPAPMYGAHLDDRRAMIPDTPSYHIPSSPSSPITPFTPDSSVPVLSKNSFHSDVSEMV
ncbi:hypothetical protein QCA50_016179 [Cerrena zonata]|uniref:Pheromone receptor n=1 Tax=Cerrena zonata TaxID=2478898 RepID=A0AAW0FPB0_9APHY